MVTVRRRLLLKKRRFCHDKREKNLWVFFLGDLETIFWLIGGKLYEAMVASIKLSWNDKTALRTSGSLGSSAVMNPSGSEIMNQASKIIRF